MKFIHCADIHIDAAMNSCLSPDKAKERRSELLAAFSRLADYADDNKVAAAIIAGDLFDKKSITAKARKFVIETIATHSSVDFLLMPGNHDRETLSYTENIPANLKLFGNSMTKFDYDDVSICGMTDFNINEVVFDTSKINILVIHGADGEDFKLRELKNRGIDYLALGHYHSYEVKKIDKRGVACYSGCLMGRGFDEAGSKGFVLLETAKGGLSHSFIPDTGRLISIIPIDLTEAESLHSQLDLINKSLDGIDRDGIVRIKIIGSYELEREKLFDGIIDKYKREFYHFELEDCSILHINENDYVNDISLKGEFIRLCMEAIEDEEERSRVIACGIHALRGEEL